MTDAMTTQLHIPESCARVYQDNSAHGEDAFVMRVLHDHMTLDAVLDGATARGGHEASTLAATALHEARITSVDDLMDLLDRTNRELFRRGRGRFFLTTVTAALRIGQTLHVLSVGDSPALLVRGPESVPLTPIVTGQTFLGLTNLLGRSEKLLCKTAHIDLHPYDRLALVTDGIIENLAPSELVDILISASTPEQAVSALQQLLCQKKRANKGRIDEHSSFRHDDATAIIRYFGPGDRP
jgi:serine/threonine protein phosphatase PrpC